MRSVLLAGFLIAAPALAEPLTAVGRDHAVKIALAHLNIDKVTPEPSQAFNLRVASDRLTAKDVAALEEPRLGRKTRHKDLAGLPEAFDVFSVTVQHGLAGDSVVFVAKQGGRVVLVQFLPEG